MGRLAEKYGITVDRAGRVSRAVGAERWLFHHQLKLKLKVQSILKSELATVSHLSLPIGLCFPFFSFLLVVWSYEIATSITRKINILYTGVIHATCAGSPIYRQVFKL